MKQGYMKLRQYRIVVCLLLAFSAISLTAQPLDKNSILRPPPGVSLALIVFEDLQCPDCARAAPMEAQAAEKYKIPVVRYNYPLPQHNWSIDASTFAEYFETKSPKLGVEFREFIFRNQDKVTRQNLRSFAEDFASKHSTILPFVVDPQGKLAETINHDRDLGQRVGLDHTPTIFIVSNTRSGPAYVEVTDRSQMFQMIEQARAEAVAPSTPAAGSAKPAAKSPAPKSKAAKSAGEKSPVSK
jgi:protein-disulfide isomerase